MIKKKTTKKAMAPKVPEKTGARRHARLGPSQFRNKELCPSHRSDKDDTAASRRGDLLHDMLETHGWRARDQKELKTAQQQDIDAIEKISHYIEPLETRAGVVIHREYEFNLEPLKVPGCDLGTGDLVILNPDDTAELIDYKMGFWEVDDVEVNIQAWLYILGVFITWPNVQTVTGHILQPWRDEVSSHVFHRSDIDRMWLRAKTIAERTELLEGVEFNPIPSNCLWCDGKATCGALHALALRGSKQAGLELPDMNLTVEDFQDLKRGGKVFASVELIEKWAVAMKWRITQLVRDGGQIEDYELKESAPKRSIISAHEAQLVCEERFGIDVAKFLNACSVSVTELGKVVASVTERGEKEKQKKIVFEALSEEGLISQSTPGLYLTRINNKA